MSRGFAVVVVSTPTTLLRAEAVWPPATAIATPPTFAALFAVMTTPLLFDPPPEPPLGELLPPPPPPPPQPTRPSMSATVEARRQRPFAEPNFSTIWTLPRVSVLCL